MKDSLNFRVIHNAEQEQLASYVIEQAERSHKVLTKYFSSFPEKTIITLNDQVDSANGSATIFPYPLIKINTAIPEFDSSISDYGNWYYELILHEYVHILNTYPANGIFSFFSLVFGNIGRPNQLLPRWHLEGLAVAIESIDSHHGRLRSPLFSAYARALTKEQKWHQFENLVELNETSTPTYPYGMRPYFFGAIYWEYLLRNFENSDLDRFNELSGKTIPYFHNNATKEIYKESEKDIYTEAISQLKTKALVQLSELENDSYPDKNPLLENFEIKLIRSNNRGEIAVVRKAINSPEEIYLINENKVIASGGNFRSLAWHPQENKLVYSKEVNYVNHNNSFDIFIYNLDKNSSHRLTTQENYKEANWTTDGNQLLAVKSKNGREGIYRSTQNLDSKTSWDKLLEAPLGFRISKLKAFDANKIIYISKSTNGRSELHIRDVSANRLTIPLGFLESFRDFSIAGADIFFISDHTGVPQAYLTKAPYTSFQKIQHSQTMFREVDYFANKEMLLFTELGTKGFRLFSSSLSPTSQAEAKIKPLFPLQKTSKPLSLEKSRTDIQENKVSSLPSESSPSSNFSIEKIEKDSVSVNNSIAKTVKKENNKTSNHKNTTANETKSYSSLQKLLPSYWFPWIYPYGEGTLFQINTGGSDPLGINTYSLSLGYDSFTKKGNHSLSYLNRAFRPDISLSYKNNYQYLQSAGQNIKREYRSFGFSNFLFTDDKSWNFFTFLNSDYNESADDKSSVNARFSLRYSNLEPGYGFAVAPMGGYSYKVGLSFYPKNKNTKAFHLYHFEGTKIFSSFLPNRHSLKFSTKFDKRSNNTSDIYASLVSGGGDTGGVGTKQFHLNRGYPFSQFLAWSMFSLNTEYIFPLWDIYRAIGELPAFSKQIFARAVLDLSLMDGYYYSQTDAAYIRDRWDSGFASFGGELVWDTTIGYHLPISFELGLYQGFKKRAGGDTRVSFRFELPLF